MMEPLDDWERNTLVAILMRCIAEGPLMNRADDQRLIALLRKLEGVDKRLWVSVNK